MSFGSFFASIGEHLKTWFGSHQTVIQTVIKDAQVAVSTAGSVAKTLGEPDSVQTVLNGIGKGLTAAAAAATAEASADTLTEQASNLTGLVGTLVSQGDLGIKNANTQTAVGVVLVKVSSVVGALEAGAAATP